MTKNDDVEQRPAYRTQYFAALTVSMSAVGAGAVLGFNSPASFQLRVAHTGANGSTTNQSDDSFVNVQQLWPSYTANQGADFFFNATDVRATSHDEIVMSTEELSWFMSVFALGALVGGLMSSPLMNTVGRKGTLLASSIPSIAGWVMTGFGRSFPTLLLGRVLTGLLLGISSSAGNAYVGEIASSDIRGLLGSFFELFLVVGIMLEMVVGAYVKWQVLALLSTAPTILFMLLMLFNKESPAFLLMKGKEEEARAALQYFRGPHYCIEKEIADVKDSQKEAQEAKFRLADLKKPYIYKPLIITLTIGMFSQLCGIEVLTSNLSTIFRNAGSDLSENTNSIICIFLEIVAGVMAIFLMERVGRKTLLIISSIFMAASHGSIGVYFYLLEVDEAWTKMHINFLPLVALVTFMLAFGIGLGPIVWILVGEMFPPLVRETAAGITIALVWTSSFLTVLSYEHLHETLHTYGFFWVYTCICALCALFCATVVKETKGKTLEEITKMFVDEIPATETETSKRDVQAS
ncbi:Sugar/inositol transporter [Trinorchestia longiramus]|nr:Sugar/inositol transporter [Trinorchestia longiramus]